MDQIIPNKDIIEYYGGEITAEDVPLPTETFAQPSTQEVITETSSENITDNLKTLINSSNLEPNEYSIISVNGVPTLVVLKYFPNTIKKGYEIFYSQYLNNVGLIKRAGKKIVVPGFEDINLRLNQDTKEVYELSTGKYIQTQAKSEANIISELETLFNSKDIRSVLQNTKKINTPDQNAPEGLPPIDRTPEQC